MFLNVEWQKRQKNGFARCRAVKLFQKQKAAQN